MPIYTLYIYSIALLHSASNALGAPSTAETDASSVGNRSWQCWGLNSGVVVQERTGTPVPVNILGPVRPPRRNAIAAAFRQMFAVKIGVACSEIRPCLM